MAQEQARENAGRVTRPRRVRTSFTSFQLSKLEETFKKMPVINRPVRYSLSLELNLQEKQIKIWFQNRRMKEKKENARVAASMATAMNSPPMLDQNQLTQMPSTSWYNPNSSHFLTPIYKNQECTEQYQTVNEVSPVEDKTSNQEQTFSDKINFYEIQQILGDIY
ncbi:PREDICTED: homeobox protein ceh-1-like [Nicrophorus vespilloides]|uniref:Homeobox protein ceh-1-like n=1 Tax=Nicrophorus vespilloides TaxID=110193 RepID=A0ABM1MSU8_NICVS|nr:PREDICTED: homeobox protein ceh-1-like [Nicrophorus vespilloides]